MPRARVALAAAAFVMLAAPGEAHACACCTNPGQRYVEVEALDSGRRAEIDQLRFADTAQLFVGEGSPDDVEGIGTPSERYALDVTWEKDRVVFRLRDDADHAGTLSLIVPNKISIFEVDPRDSPDRGTGPVLYKEWKLTGEVTGTGAFSGTNSAKQLLTLILQGRGNSCTGAADFTHWTLVTEGPKGTYSLFGDLTR